GREQGVVHGPEGGVSLLRARLARELRRGHRAHLERERLVFPHEPKHVAVLGTERRERLLGALRERALEAAKLEDRYARRRPSARRRRAERHLPQLLSVFGD